MTNLVDTSGWLEFFTDGPYASYFLEALRDMDRVIVPAHSYYEVFAIVMRERDESDALQVAALMQQARPVDITAAVSVFAGRLGVAHQLPFSSSVTLAVARLNHATIWTQDACQKDFSGLNYYPKRTA